MKKILAIMWKDTVLRFASAAEWLFFIILPIVFTVVLAGGTGAPKDARVRLVVVDQAHSSLSTDLISALQQSQAVRPEVQSLAKAESQFKQRQASAVLVIPAEFDLQHLQQGQIEIELRQQPNNMNALIAARAVQAVTGRISSTADIARRSVAEAERITPFASSEARTNYMQTALEQAQTQMSAAPNRVAEAKGATKDQVEYDPRANSSAGQLITWVFIPLIAISSMFAYERQTGTLRRLLTTPTGRGTYLLGTILGQVVIALVQMLLLVAFGITIMHLNWGHSPAALAVMLLAAALAAGALGTMLGTFVKTEGQAQGLSIMLGMVMALLGGCWYPLEFFPRVVQNVVKVLPTTWAMQGMLNIVLRGQGLAAVMLPAAVLLGFAAVFYTIGVWRFRFE